MKDFKKGGFGSGRRSGAFNKGGFGGGERGQGGFGGPKRDFSTPVELHQATCARCHKTCEVPFRPNGKKPVFCKDCFTAGRPDASAHGHGHARPDMAPRPARAFPVDNVQPRPENLKPQLEALNVKLDTMMRMLKALEQTQLIAATPAQKAVKAPAKKAVKKASKK